MPTKKSGWKSKKGRHLKFRLPDGADVNGVFKQFDAGQLTVIALQTDECPVAIISSRSYQFLEDIVPVEHTLVSRSVSELIELLEELCEPLEEPSDDDEMEDVVPSSFPEAVQSGSSNPASPSETNEEDQRPSSEDEEDEDQSVIEETDEEEPSAYIQPDGNETDTSADQASSGGEEQKDEDEDDDEVEEIEEIPRKPEPTKGRKRNWALHTSATENERGHQTAETLALGDEDGEAARVIGIKCGEKDPENCKWCNPKVASMANEEEEEEVSLVKIRKIRNAGGKNRSGTLSLEACNKAVDKLFAAQQKVLGLVPTKSECARQAKKDGMAAHESSIRKKLTAYYDQRLSELKRRKVVNEKDYFIK